MAYPVPETRTVLITGCSSGIGFETALYLRKKGWQVIATARREHDLQKLHEQGFHPQFLELSDSSSIAETFREVMRFTDDRLGGIVNNGGYGQPGALEDLSRKAMKNQFEVNVFGMQELTNLCIPVFRKQGFGRIVTVSSGAARMGLPLAGIYCASKSAVETMADVLRLELHGSGVAVSLIEAGAVETHFMKKVFQRTADFDLNRSEFRLEYLHQLQLASNDTRPVQRFISSPHEIAEKIQHALESRWPARRYRLSASVYWVDLLRRLAPDWFIDSYLLYSWKKRRRK